YTKNPPDVAIALERGRAESAVHGTRTIQANNLIVGCSTEAGKVPENHDLIVGLGKKAENQRGRDSCPRFERIVKTPIGIQPGEAWNQIAVGLIKGSFYYNFTGVSSDLLPHGVRSGWYPAAEGETSPGIKGLIERPIAVQSSDTGARNLGAGSVLDGRKAS